MPSTETRPVLEATGLTKCYGRRPALTDCDLTVPYGRVIGLVGPNGAGKSTLLHLACGLITPSSGTLRVLGSPPAANATHLAKVGFVAQDAPVYAGLTVADHLRMGARLNPGWDQALARRRIDDVGLDPRRRAGRLSGGQRAQLALTVAAAKRPDLLILDEPAAALDPLARDAFLEGLMEFVAELGVSALLSSHLLSDVERVCDHLIVLCGSRVQLAGDVADLLAGHRTLVAPRGGLRRLPAGLTVVHGRDTERHSRAVVRADGPGAAERWRPADAPWSVEPTRLEELVLAYLTRASEGSTAGAAITAGEAGALR